MYIKQETEKLYSVQGKSVDSVQGLQCTGYNCLQCTRFTVYRVQLFTVYKVYSVQGTRELVKNSGVSLQNRLHFMPHKVYCEALVT